MRPQTHARQGERGRSTPRRLLLLESLEERNLLSAAWPLWLAPQPAQTGQATLDAAMPLVFHSAPGGTSPVVAGGAAGAIGNGAGGEVDWYCFTLNAPSAVSLTTFDVAGGRHLDGAVSLYNTDPVDPFYPFDFASPPFSPQGHRLLAQLDGLAAPGASLERALAAGTYFVAVSGHGNLYFNPLLAESGYAGATGDYRLLVTAAPLPSGPDVGPAVLGVDLGPTAGGAGIPVLHSSPDALRVRLSAPIEPGTVSLMQPWSGPDEPPPTVRLLYNPAGAFGGSEDRDIFLAGSYYAAGTQELQLKLAAPLAPGSYRLTLAGDPGPDGLPVLTDATGAMLLGQDADHPGGRDYTFTFRVDGSEGRGRWPAGDDTPSASRDLGALANRGIVQVAGMVGDDPAYDPSLPWPDPEQPPFLVNPASDVDLYHFRVSGPGQYHFAAEVFAGRIGSTLDAALALFRVEGGPGRPLQLVASNDDSGNPTLTSDGGFRPLLTDPLLSVGLRAGDYYLAVSSKGNAPGLPGGFGPGASHSGYAGTSTGDYVLNVLLQPVAPAPRVVATSIGAREVLGVPPAEVVVTFDSRVNVTALANQAFEATSEATVSGVFVVGPGGERYFPRLQSYDVATNRATFLMLDRLPNGANELHLSGGQGLTGLGGAALVGNSPSGDHVVYFTVLDPFAPADPLSRAEQPGQGAGQDLGALFPRELQSGVAISGVLQAAAPGDTPEADTYVVRLLAPQQYLFTLAAPGGGPATGLRITVTGEAGVAEVPLPGSNPNALMVDLGPGTYTVRVERETPEAGESAPYEARAVLLGASENPPPLSTEASPALRFRGLEAAPQPLASPPPSQLVEAPAVSLAGVFAHGGELAGGATGGPQGASLVSGPPALVRGLDAGARPASAGLPSVSALVGGLLVAPLMPADELFPEAPGGRPGGASLDWAEWVARCEGWLVSLAGPSSQPAVAPPAVTGRPEGPGGAAPRAAVAPAPEAAGDSSEVAAAGPRGEAGVEEVGPGPSFAWVLVLGLSGLAAVACWGRWPWGGRPGEEGRP